MHTGSQKPVIQLYNPAVKKITDIEFSNEKSYENQNVFSAIQNEDLDAPVFQLKVQKEDQNALSDPLILTVSQQYIKTAAEK